jgi:hypothetical protein
MSVQPVPVHFEEKLDSLWKVSLVLSDPETVEYTAYVRADEWLRVFKGAVLKNGSWSCASTGSTFAHFQPYDLGIFSLIHDRASKLLHGEDKQEDKK